MMVPAWTITLFPPLSLTCAVITYLLNQKHVTNETHWQSTRFSLCTQTQVRWLEGMLTVLFLALAAAAGERGSQEQHCADADMAGCSTVPAAGWPPPIRCLTSSPSLPLCPS